MILEEKVLRRLMEISSGGWFTTKQLDSILEEEWLAAGRTKYDAQMHCNSMMRRGLIDYRMDGEWELLVTEEELDEMVAENEQEGT
jgi:hypothetical protein